MADVAYSNRQRYRKATEEKFIFYIIFTLIFMMSLVAAFGERLLPVHWGASPPGRDARKTILGQALDQARTIAPYAFMG